MSNEKFKKLAIARVNKALNTIRLIGNLSNKSHYTYSDDEARKIITSLENEIKSLRNKFRINQRNNIKKGFNFD